MKGYVQILLAVASVLSIAVITPAASAGDSSRVRAGHLSFARAVTTTRAPQTTGSRRRRARSRRRTVASQSGKPQTGGTNAQTAANQTSQANASQGPLSQVRYELPLRKPGAGEQREQGLLTDVACDAKGVTFKITVGARTLKLWTPDLNRIHFATYTPDVSGEIRCGARRPANPVVVVFRPAKAAAAKSDGTPVSVEFVPKNFK